MPSKWHLKVKRNGKPDHGLMGAAWAALHSGYRGNKYEGPDKAKAHAALKRLYKLEDMQMPEMKESIEENDGYENEYTPYSIVSFYDLQQYRDTRTAINNLEELIEDFQKLAKNIVDNYQVENKRAALSNLLIEFKDLLQDGVEQAEQNDSRESQETDGEAFAESIAGVVEVVELQESDSSLLEMDVQLIRPGWGNSRDGHYYPADMLKSYAEEFVGSKMYETDHRPAEKSTRTWVSTVKEISRFADDGAPIARVVVHDPGFAERVRNLKDAGLLEKMECSILAGGTASKKNVDGKKAKVVESITGVSSVDWVTRAGAGGHATSLVESEGGTMTEEDETVEGAVKEAAEETQIEEVAEDATAETVAETKETTFEKTQIEEVAEDATAETVAETKETTFEKTQLEKSHVSEVLGKSKLPEPSVERLSERDYDSDESLNETIRKEIDYVKKITGSGKPFGMGETQAPKAARMSETEYEDAMNGVFNKYLGG